MRMLRTLRLERDPEMTDEDVENLAVQFQHLELDGSHWDDLENDDQFF